MHNHLLDHTLVCQSILPGALLETFRGTTGLQEVVVGGDNVYGPCLSRLLGRFDIQLPPSVALL